MALQREYVGLMGMILIILEISIDAKGTAEKVGIWDRCIVHERRIQILLFICCSST